MLPQQSSGGQVVSVPASSNGIHEVHVTANGTGCPTGTTSSVVSKDGKTFTTTFRNYEAVVSPTATISVKDCQLGFQIRSRGNFQYAIESYSFAGHAKLDQDVNARLQTSYSFQGNPAQSTGKEFSIKGPYDDAFRLQNTLSGSAQIWSPCAAGRDINLVTRARLQNSTPARSGKVTAEHLVVRLTQRSCS